MTQPGRSGGRLEPSLPVSFTFDGTEYRGFVGDTLASALLANGVHRVSTSIKFGRPRGIVSAGVEEPNAIVQVDAPFCEPMVNAATVELFDGLRACSLRGQGRLATTADPGRYDAINSHCDVLVVGGGPAGVQAAWEAADAGQRVILIDDQPQLGGSAAPRPTSAAAGTAATVAQLLGRANVRVLTRTSVFAHHDANYLLALQRRTNHLGVSAPTQVARERVWRIRAREVVLATGAHERLIAFAGNDLPGVMLAGSVATYAERYGVLAGHRVVIFTNNDSALRAADAMAAAGIEIAEIVDVRHGAAVVRALGTDHLDGVEVLDADGARHTVPADLLAVSGGWNPAVHLFSQAGGTLRWDEAAATFVPGAPVPGVRVVGSAAGAGLDSVTPCWVSPGTDPQLSFVDLQRDVTVADLQRATGAGLRSVEHVKRYTTAGTAHDQGKTSGVLTSGVVAAELGREIAELGTTTFRGPYVPVSFAALAGRSGGDLLDPVRTTSMHSWHVDHGAVFENVGQWKRPLYYPHPDPTGSDRIEEMPTAVLRECATTRSGVGFLDASTLGKIEVQGADAGVLLDLLYTNMMSTLKVGAIRYGVMCKADGMVFDDGTVMRLAADRFLLTTTTGNAAAVLDWMEEWLQTEWPQLRAYCTSVTEQWATIALVGPESRQVLAALAPTLDVSNEAFGFMTWRDAAVAELPARVARISFSGELAYELNVAWWHGLALWQAVAAAGAPFGITPYGTETMHVLRAEKGYPIIGQDTDGTVTPQDLGLGWVVSKTKADFIGKRSFARPENNRPDRKHLVGLLPEDGNVLLREGTQLVAFDSLPEPPVPTLGHVTSSYRSAALGCTFALALVRGGRERIGERIWARVGTELIAVTVAEPVLFDPQGARRDG